MVAALPSTMRHLRPAFLLALASAAVASQAAVRYTFVGTFLGGQAAFTLTTGSLITTTTTIPRSAFDSSRYGFGVDFFGVPLGTLNSVTFTPNAGGFGFGSVLNVNSTYFGNDYSDLFFFGAYDFESFGTHQGSGDSTLTVESVVPAAPTVPTVPGPMAALPFALMALRRRKRA